MPVMWRGYTEGQLTARRVLPWAALVLLFSAVPHPASAQNTDWNRYTLEDLTGVYVRFDIQARCVGFEVDEARLRQEAESVLEDAEVPLLTEAEMLAAPGLPDLRVTVECAENDGRVAYSIWLRMQQAARMVRNEQLQLSEAVTWYTTALGVTDDDDVADDVRDALKERMEEFAGAFRQANADTETPS